MNESDTAKAQALSLLALALEADADAYIAQINSIAQPYLVIHKLVELLYDCTPADTRLELAFEIHNDLADKLS